MTDRAQITLIWALQPDGSSASLDSLRVECSASAVFAPAG